MLYFAYFSMYGLYCEPSTTLAYEHFLLEKLSLEFSKLSRHKVHKEEYKWTLSVEDLKRHHNVTICGRSAKICKL